MCVCVCLSVCVCVLVFAWPHVFVCGFLRVCARARVFVCCNAQGKSFIKDALKCMAHGLRHKFSCISRKCVSIKEMVFQLQRECYLKHNLCSAAKENVAVMVEMIHFQDLFPKG